MPGFIKTPADEAAWQRAKSAVRKQYPNVSTDSPKFYRLTTSIWKSMRHKDSAAEAMAEYAYTDSDGKGHLPIGDAGHVRNALARFGQTFFESLAKAKAAWGHIQSAARKFGIKSEASMPHPKVKEPSSGYKKASAEDSNIATFAVALPSDDAPEWIELLPAGKFSAVDGRGPFENEDPASIVAASTARMPEVGLVLDYDHSTDLAAPEGRQSIAAGWIKQFRVAENGAIFARIEWTAKAAEALKAKEYRYISPVFEHSKDGKVERILRAALTNNPALINLPALASAQRETMAKKEEGTAKMGLADLAQHLQKIPGMTDELMMKHLALHAEPDGDEPASPYAPYEAGGSDDASAKEDAEEEEAATADSHYEEETEEQMTARHEEEMSKCQDEEARSRMARKHMAQRRAFTERTDRNRGMEIKSKVADQKGDKSLQAAIAKSPMVVRMATELNQMRAAQAKASATEKVDRAIREGRLIPSQREWAIEYCSGDAHGFAKFIGAQPKILKSGADGTFTGRIGEPKEGVETLSAKEITIFNRLGLAESLGGREKALEKFLAAKKERLSHAATLDAD